MDELDLFRRLHGQVQAGVVGPPEPNDVSYADHLLAELSDEQMRLRPGPAQNSCAWLMWHVTRAEDLAINTMIAGSDQVLDAGDWLAQLAVPYRSIGTGMSTVEVTDFSRRVDIGALREYRTAVGLRTKEVVGGKDRASWEEPTPPDHLRRAVREGAFTAPAQAFMEAFWSNRPRKWFLWQPTGHSFYHLGEIACVRSQGGFPAIG
jgi:hypothetical protein